MLPLYANAKPGKSKPQDAHSGLWYERFFDRYVRDAHATQVPDKAEKEGNPKTDWIGTVAGPAGDAEQIETQVLSRHSLADQLGGASRVFVNDWHFVTGLGNPHPVENGFAWHPVLGVPYLPGSAVKGLLRSYVEVWREDYRYMIADWFGGEEKQVPGYDAGNLIFFDALPIEPPDLCVDIMTPHMGGWYAEGAERPNEEDTVPADWHDPTPIPFLAARRIKLLFSIAPRPGARTGGKVKEALDLLEEALDISGAGAKTAAGYGLMARHEAGENALVQKSHVAHDQRERSAARRVEAYQRRGHERRAEQKAARLEQLEGSDRRLAEIEQALQEHRDRDEQPRSNSPLLQEVNAALDEAAGEAGDWSTKNARRLIALAEEAWELAGMGINSKRQRKIDAVERQIGD